MPVIRQQTQFFNRPIGVSSFDTGETAVYQAVSDFANTVGRIAINEGTKLAEKRGIEEAQSLTSEQVVEMSKQKETARGLQTIQQEKFNEVLDRRFVDTINNDIQLKSKEIAQKYEDPVAYEKVFGSYLNDLTSGTSERFKGVVTEISKYEMADTKLTLAAAARKKARARLVDELITTNNQFEEAIFDQANTGNDTATLALIEERVTATSDAEQADLPIKAGASQQVRSNMGGIAVSGMLSSMMPNVEDPIEQAAIQAYIQSQGQIGGDLIDAGRLERLDQYLPYVDINNTPSIITSFNRTTSNLNSIRAAQAEKANSLAASEARQRYVEFGDTLDTLQMTYSAFAITASNSPNLAEARGGFQFIQDDFEERKAELDSIYISGQLGKEEYNSQLRDVRRAGLDAMVLAAASGGNIEALQTYITSGNPADLAQLTAAQRNITRFLSTSPLYDVQDDRDYVESLLRGSKNEVRERVEREIRNANLANKANQISKEITAGKVNTQDIELLVGEINRGLQNGDFNATRHTNLMEALGAAQGKGIINFASSTATSFDMIALTNYIRTNGVEDEGLSEVMREAGNAILEATPESKRSEVSNHANTVREKMAAKEAETAAQVAETRLRNDIKAGVADGSQKSVRIAADKVLEELGIDPRSPDSRNPLFYSMMRTAPAESMVQGLKLLASGQSAVGGSDILLDHYVSLANDPSATGLINRFGRNNILSKTEIAFLNDVAEIRENIGGNAADIANDLMERRNDKMSDIHYNNVFKTQSPAQMLLEDLPRKLRNPVIAAEFAPVAEYYARVGAFSKKEIIDRVSEIADGLYTNDAIVVDPRFPLGKDNVTQFGLATVIPDEKTRNEFVKSVNLALPDGYSLIPAMSRQGATEQKVHLVPDFEAQDYAYFAYTEDATGMLVPLMYEQDGELTWPYFDKEIIAEFVGAESAKRTTAIENALDEAEARQQRLFDSTWEGQAKMIDNLISQSVTP